MVITAPHHKKTIDDLVDPFKKDLNIWKEANTKTNHEDLVIHVREGHDIAYQSIMKKFNDLANHEDKDERLAERGEELSEKHINDLLESYILPFLEHSLEETGKSLVEEYKELVKDKKLKDHEKFSELIKLYQHGFGEEGGQQVLGHMKQLLQPNQTRSHTVLQDGQLMETISKEGKSKHIEDIYGVTLGKTEYRRKNELAKIALDDVTGGRYDIHEDKDGKKVFKKHDVNSLKELLSNSHQGHYSEDKDLLKKKYGLKLKSAKYE